MDEEGKEEKQEQTEKTLPVLHLQGQEKKDYTLVLSSSSNCAPCSGRKDKLLSV